MSSSFTTTELALPGVLLITPKVWPDDRGFFVNTYSESELEALGLHARFVQDNLSRSKHGVIRGLHYQRAPYAQAKLVRCTLGKVFDVVAECNPESAHFGEHLAVELDADTQTMLYIPGQYAHGFCVMSEEAIVEYKATDTYHPEASGGALFDDPLLNISWPVPHPILSPQDRTWEPLSAPVARGIE